MGLSCYSREQTRKPAATLDINVFIFVKNTAESLAPLSCCGIHVTRAKLPLGQGAFPVWCPMPPAAKCACCWGFSYVVRCSAGRAISSSGLSPNHFERALTGRRPGQM